MSAPTPHHGVSGKNARPGIGFVDAALTVVFAYVVLVIVRAVGGVTIPMWAFPVALALTGAACYIGAGLGAAAREKGGHSGE